MISIGMYGLTDKFCLLLGHLSGLHLTQSHNCKLLTLLKTFSSQDPFREYLVGKFGDLESSGIAITVIGLFGAEIEPSSPQLDLQSYRSRAGTRCDSSH